MVHDQERVRDDVRNGPATEPFAIDVSDLRKAYGEKMAVDGVSFSVPRGSILGLLGPNGAGKTTTIGCLTTLLRPDGGTARVGGFDVTREPAKVRSQIVVTGQSVAVDEALTGRENLLLFGRLFGMSKQMARQRADALLERLDLVAAGDQTLRTYSGGMRRRLDLAISLMAGRPIVFLDEPTTGLDPRSRQELWDMVRELRAEGRTVLLTTQYLEEAERLADRIVVIDHGRLVADGTAEELKKRVGGAVCAITVADPVARVRAAEVLGPRFSGVSTTDDVITLPTDGFTTVAAVVGCLVEAGVDADDIATRRPTLDDVFFALTGQTRRHS